MERFLAKARAAVQSNGAGTPGLFWRGAIVFSLVVNALLVVALLIAVAAIFEIRRQVADPLVSGLHTSFVEMNQASIVTTIAVSDTILVEDTIPVVFDLPLNQATTVVLTQDTPIPRTIVNLNGIGIPTDITLPAGTPLNINLNLSVPVSQTVPVRLRVPVRLQVPVNIPLNQTELSTPFTRLERVVSPYQHLLEALPASWGEVLTGRP
jgi:hypothetical protein